MNSLLRLMCLLGLLSMVVVSLPIRSTGTVVSVSTSAPAESAIVSSVVKYLLEHELVVFGALGALLVVSIAVVVVFAWILRQSSLRSTEDDSEVPMTSCHPEEMKKEMNCDVVISFTSEPNHRLEGKVETTPPPFAEAPTTGELESVTVISMAPAPLKNTTKNSLVKVAPQPKQDKLRESLSSFNRTPDSKLVVMLRELESQPPKNEKMKEMLEFVSDPGNLREASRVELMRNWMRAFLFDKYSS